MPPRTPKNLYNTMKPSNLGECKGEIRPHLWSHPPPCGSALPPTPTPPCDTPLSFHSSLRPSVLNLSFLPTSPISAHPERSPRGHSGQAKFWSCVRQETGEGGGVALPRERSHFRLQELWVAGAELMRLSGLRPQTAGNSKVLPCHAEVLLSEVGGKQTIEAFRAGSSSGRTGRQLDGRRLRQEDQELEPSLG